ncbi:HEAT repeat domain-containing protein [Actinomadura kijaniata]|uniref:HEAT repeat domain-containing protein n=1 Tax=Actinomadura kijaniata TaxID=46161 RepID=UPI000829D32F|nr:HEAT repeat domain-containing protein [Actinomadura kijaniata]
MRAEETPVRARIAELTDDITARPGRVRDEPPGELLYQAVRGVRAAEAADPGALARELAATGDPVLRGEALRIVREALHDAALTPARARGLLVGLTEVDDIATGEVLRELAEPWAALEPLTRDRLARFLGTGHAEAALGTAARHGHADLLREVAADPGRPPALRRRALELLGGLARREDVPALVGIAATDPLLLAGPAVRCLRGMHRRGHFPAPADVPGVVALALADHTVPAGEVATVLFTCRAELLRALTDGGGDWPRRLELLTALAAQGTGDLPVGDAVTRALRTARDPEPFLRALRDLRHVPAEEDVLEALPRSPGAALDALEAIGGERTAEVLRAGLGVDGGHPVLAHLRPVRHRALEVLWHLTEDPGRRRSILVRLNPRDLPRRIAADLGGPDERELAVLRTGLAAGQPADALCRLARNGGRATLPAIADLLLRVVSDLAAAWTTGAQPHEPDVPQEVRGAIRGLGTRLHERGAIRPRCLLDAANATDAGHALLADLALDLLERPDVGAAEQMVLLRLLQDVPDARARVRARVHPLLRHRDRHVRKHAIDLLARTGGADALSASLIPLTAAPDVQTVRQAVSALGGARAAWAAEAVAACLDHPNMNVKKTAATALCRAGAPAAVPKLLYWLGAHDNPGLRESIVEALRSVLGGAWQATVIAAAERAEDHRTRTLLLQGLPEPKKQSPPPDPDVEALTALGWDAGPGRRLALRDDLDPKALKGLRPMLERWLDLAADDRRLRGPALRFALRLCPAPWSDGEVRSFARSAPTLVAGLTEVGDEDRDRLVAALEQALPRLPDARRAEIAERVRALPPGAVDGRGLLVLLRRAGAFLTRADLDRALAAAPLPTLEEVLREAFGTAPRRFHAAGHAPGSGERPDTGDRWRAALREAVTSPARLRRFRAADHPADHPADSRDRLDALIRVFPEAGAGVRAALLDWMTELQPIDAPPWTIAEEARGVPDHREPDPRDLDQPRSAAQRERLLAMLDDPDPGRRATAARVLAGWPEPEIGLTLLRAFLRGRIEPPLTADLARPLTELDGRELREGDTAFRTRAARAAAHLDPLDAARLVPLLLDWWEDDDRDLRAAVAGALRHTAPDLLADRLAGNPALLGVLTGVPLLATPALRRTLRELRDAGHGDRVDQVTLVEGPLRAPDAVGRDAATLAALRARTRPPGAQTPDPEDLFRTARTGAVEEARRALTTLAETHPGPELAELLVESIGHPERRIRLHAHRLARTHLDRAAYLEQTARLLDDPAPDVVRSAIRTLSHAGWRPLIPTLADLLTHSDQRLRRAAAEGLARFGTAALPALRHAEGRARPDRRPRYTALIEEITG